MTEKNNEGNKPKETTEQRIDDIDFEAVDIIENDKTISEVEKMIQILEENKELKKIIAEFDKKSKDFKFKDILELDKKMIVEAEKATKERNDYLLLLQRFKADFENYKKRSLKQVNNNIQFSSERIISKIFEPIEDVDRAIKFAEEKNHDFVPLEGLQIIHSKLTRILEDEQVTIIEPKQGDDFDPRYHEAICIDPTGEHKPGEIVQLLEKGYKLKGRVLRAAKIMVGAEKEE